MIAALAGSHLVLSLGAALLGSLWQATLVAAALAIVLRLIPEGQARARYAAACLSLAGAAIWPAASFVAALDPGAPRIFDASPAAVAEAAAPPASAIALALLTAAWAVGVAVSALRLAVGIGRTRALTRTGIVPLPDEVHAAFARLCERLGLTRAPRLLGSLRADVPMVIGALRPVVLLPIAVLAELPPSHVEALLAHELAHVKRFDVAVGLLLAAAEAALFFHPAARWIAGRVRAEREHAADDLASTLFGRVAYARALFDLESTRAKAPEPALGSNGGSLVIRIRRLLAGGARPPRRPRSPLATALVTTALVGLGAAALHACAPASSPESRAAGEGADASTVHIPWLPPALEPYRQIFAGAAARHGVDADALAIMTLVESCGDPAAESPMGALGLMQLMPATADRIAGERGLGAMTAERLHDPEVNVDLGAWYLAQQVAAFGRDADERRMIELATAAYNAGPRAVRAHLDRGSPLPDETARYIALITGMWSERREGRSTTFAAWRERVRARAAERAGAPIAGAPVSLPFGAPSQGEAHQGVDIASPEGTPIVAPLDGTVVQAGPDGDHGQVVVLRHGGGIETRYHHLASVGVRQGDRVTRSAPIGAVGATGKVTAAHLHFEVRDMGTPVDPAPYLAAKN